MSAEMSADSSYQPNIMSRVNYVRATAPSKAWVYDRSPAGVKGSNTARGTHVYLL